MVMAVIVYVVGHPLVDDFLRFAGGRARPNTVRAYAHDLKTFFSVVAKDPVEVRAQDVFGFITAQQRLGSVRRTWPGSPMAGRGCRRRRCGDGWPRCRRSTAIWSPVAMSGWRRTRCRVGLPTRRRRRDGRGLPLVRGVRRLPRILEPAEVTALLGALRTERDRAMVQAMVLGGLRRCEVLGLRLEDLRLGEWRVFIADGKGGHQRLVPLSPSFFATVAAYMNSERPGGCGDGSGVRRVEGPEPGSAVVGRRAR